MIEARGFDVDYGRGQLARLLEDLGPWVAVTQPEPWALLGPSLPHAPLAQLPAGDLRPAHLDQLAAGLPDGTTAVVGIGGGSAMDTAKWLHWRTGLPLYQVPSLPSVDACFTRMTALRDAGGVRYEGDSVPEVVVVDFDLMWSAPRDLVAGGIGDVLSCHTALHDWRLGDAAGRDAPWDEAAAGRAREYLDDLEALAPLLAVGDDAGLRGLMECHRDIGWLCHELGHARFEEGSEHFWAYAFEHVTGRTILHGELVTLGVLVMSTLQSNDPGRPRRIADAAGTRTRLDELGVEWEEVAAALVRLPSFVEEQGLWFSAANGLSVGDAELGAARAALGLPPA
jgi:glycerol-1-phosphate dehydrogenase [NAD(P)+]